MANQLTPEQKLDITLDFLTQVNAGSYLYPDTIKLKQHLLSKGIAEEEHLPIIFHLKKGEYVDLYYNDEDRRKRQEHPHQIKVTFKGIKFHDKGGYTKLLLKEKRRECIQEIQQWLSIPTFVIAIITVFVVVLREPKNIVKIEYSNLSDSLKSGTIQQIKNVSITINNKDTTIHIPNVSTNTRGAVTGTASNTVTAIPESVSSNKGSPTAKPNTHK